MVSTLIYNGPDDVCTYPSTVLSLSPRTLAKMSMMVKIMAKQIAVSKIPNRGDRLIKVQTFAPYDLAMTWSKATLVKIHQGSLCNVLSTQIRSEQRCDLSSEDVPHQRLIRSDMPIHIINIVEKPKIIEDLIDERRNGHQESTQIHSLNDLAEFRIKERPGADEERFDLDPCHNVMQEIRTVKQ